MKKVLKWCYTTVRNEEPNDVLNIAVMLFLFACVL